MVQNVVDCTKRHLIVGTGVYAEQVASLFREQGIELDSLAPGELRRVDPAPAGKWWARLSDAECRLYAGVIVTTADCGFVAAEVTGTDESSSHLAAGLVPVGYCNMYFLQSSEEPLPPELVERGVRLVLELVRIQPSLEYPAGALLRRIGMRAPMPWWQHSIVARSETRVCCWVVQQLPALQTVLMRGDPRTARIRATAGLLREAGRGADPMACDIEDNFASFGE